MNTPLTVECDIHFRTAAKGRKKVARGTEPTAPALKADRVPRVARLMALAIRFEGLVRDGVVADYADIARLGRVSRARVSQIMLLLQLAPEIQETVLFMAPTENGRETVREKQLRRIATTIEWTKQRRMWREVRSERSS